MGNPGEPYTDVVSTWFRDVTGHSVASVGERLFGATTATIVPFSSNTGDDFVAKIYDRNIPGVGPDDVRRDAVAMEAAGWSALRTPRLVDADADAVRVGYPALLMSRLPGEPRAFGGDDPDGWVDGLADALIDIADAPQPMLDVAQYQRWVPDEFVVPSWSARPSLWQSVAEAISDDPPSATPRFIHRDFHQLNVLWADGVPTGTVDWVNGCLGPIESDIASARVNIALADRRYDGIALADRFLQRCEAAGLPWHPLWDLDFIAGVTDRPEMFLIGCDFGADMTVDSVSNVLETMSAHALERSP